MHRISIVLFALALVTHCSISSAQEASVERTDRINSLFSEYSRGISPGLAVAVVRDGKVLFAKGYGLASLDTAFRSRLLPSSTWHRCRSSSPGLPSPCW